MQPFQLVITKFVSALTEVVRQESATKDAEGDIDDFVDADSSFEHG